MGIDTVVNMCGRNSETGLNATNSISFATQYEDQIESLLKVDFVLLILTNKNVSQ